MNRLFVILIVSVGLILTVGGYFFIVQPLLGGEPKAVSFEEDVFAAGAILGASHTRFIHPEYGFSVEYPNELEVVSFEESNGGETIVFRQKNSPDIFEDKVGFQVFVSPFEEDIQLTPERIKEDLPFAVIDEAQEISIGQAVEETIDALLFWSEDPSIGRTREVWFVHDGYLYEVTTFEHLDTWLAGILSTWRFVDG